jgi:hypothetical protein
MPSVYQKGKFKWFFEFSAPEAQQSNNFGHLFGSRENTLLFITRVSPAFFSNGTQTSDDFYVAEARGLKRNFTF